MWQAQIKTISQSPTHIKFGFWLLLDEVQQLNDIASISVSAFANCSDLNDALPIICEAVETQTLAFRNLYDTNVTVGDLIVTLGLSALIDYTWEI